MVADDIAPLFCTHPVTVMVLAARCPVTAPHVDVRHRIAAQNQDCRFNVGRAVVRSCANCLVGLRLDNSQESLVTFGTQPVFRIAHAHNRVERKPMTSWRSAWRSLRNVWLVLSCPPIPQRNSCRSATRVPFPNGAGKSHVACIHDALKGGRCQVDLCEIARIQPQLFQQHVNASDALISIITVN